MANNPNISLNIVRAIDSCICDNIFGCINLHILGGIRIHMNTILSRRKANYRKCKYLV